MDTNVFRIAIDIGTDTVKSAFAYSVSGDKIEYGKFVVNEDDDSPYPSLAYYNKGKSSWVFGSEVKNALKDSFRYIVKIRDLLNLIIDGSEENIKYYTSNKLFPNFYFPPISDKKKGFGELVKKNMTFEAEQTPREVCGKFFESYFASVIRPNVKNIITSRKYAPKEIAISLVYPLGADKRYVEELVRLAKNEAVMLSVFLRMNVSADIGTISAPKAIGLYSYHVGAFSGAEKALIFNVGESEISLAQIVVNDGMVCVDGADGHNLSEQIGGKDCDNVILDIINAKVAKRAVLGVSDGAEKPMETGTYYEQFMLMECIKQCKKMFCIPEAQYNECFGENGVFLKVERDVSIYTRISKKEFLNGLPGVGVQGCYGSVYDKIWKYIEKELVRPSNKGLSSIVLSGGASEVFGLADYIEKKLAAYNKQNSQNTSLVNFDNCVPRITDKYSLLQSEDMVYSAAVGAAVHATKLYKFTMIAGLSYGTWGRRQDTGMKFYCPIVNIGAEIGENARLSTSFRAGGSSMTTMIPIITGDEMFSMTTNDSVDVGEPGSYIRSQAIAKYGLNVISGEGGKGEIRFSRPVKSSFKFLEGVAFDADGAATPFVENDTEMNPPEDRDVVVSIFGLNSILIKGSRG